MRKALIVIGSIILAVSVLFICVYFALTTPKFIGDFSVDEFRKEMDNVHFQTEINYGKIDDYKSAANAGKKAISDRFEDSDGSIFKWMGCSVQYDAENDSYHVSTFRLAFFMKGGGYKVILKSDGTVLAIWGVK